MNLTLSEKPCIRLIYAEAFQWTEHFVTSFECETLIENNILLVSNRSQARFLVCRLPSDDSIIVSLYV